ncbi:MAG: hypothetical protein GX078_05855 [Clostridiales bacterium]|nr:hypothetical protein [Clostridiales bacterium]
MKKKFLYILPLIITVTSTVLYQVSAKQVPTDINEGAIIVIAYSIGILLCFLFYLITEKLNLFADIETEKEPFKLSKAPIIMGVAITASEIGNIIVYRVGWDISVAGTFTNISVAVVLAIIGIMIYRESVSMQKVLGLLVCISGLIVLGL